MAFIVPVVRKDYNLFPATVPQLPQKRTKATPGGKVRGSRLTKSLPLFPTAAKPTAGEIRRQCSAMSHPLDEHRSSTQARSRAGTTIAAGPASRRATYPLKESLSRPTVIERVESSTTSHDDGTATSSPLDIKRLADSGYTTSASGSPFSSTETEPDCVGAPATMSAPNSPTLNHNRNRSALRHSNASTSSSASTSTFLSDEGRASSPTAGAATRHVHFGLCEQIEYECPLKRDDSAPTKYGRLKRFEQRLAAQLKSKLLFRPRLYSMPLSSHNNLLSRKSQVALKDERPTVRLTVDEHLGTGSMAIPPV